jgi:hypothetical protein
MRTLLLSVLFLFASNLVAQDFQVRLDGGYSAWGCQGSYIDRSEISWLSSSRERLGGGIELSGPGNAFKVHAETWLAGGRWYWGGHGKWYSGLMGGWSHHWSTGTRDIPLVDGTDFAHQITFIGFRSGGLIGLSFEVGQGYKGFFSTGLSVAF